MRPYLITAKLMRPSNIPTPGVGTLYSNNLRLLVWVINA
jgi:hypothetical protein